MTVLLTLSPGDLNRALSLITHHSHSISCSLSVLVTLCVATRSTFAPVHFAMVPCTPLHNAQVRSYVMDLLLELVFVHEEVNTTAKGELEAVMKAALEKLAQCTLECVKQIDTFNRHGALQVPFVMNGHECP